MLSFVTPFNEMADPHDVIQRQGGPEMLWPIWSLAKRISLNLQAHLSAILALAIVGVMILRESKDLGEIVHEPLWLLFIPLAIGVSLSGRYIWLLWVPANLRWKIHVLYSLVLVLTIAIAAFFGPDLVALYHAGPLRLVILILAVFTLGAALWEVVGDKVSSSHRDIWFSVAMREAIRQFHEMLTRKQPMSDAELVDWYGKFLDWVLEYSSKALCGRKRVHAGFLVVPPDRDDVLRLFKASTKSGYPDGVEIDLPKPDRPGGAAGVAFMLPRPGVVYVPYRKKKQAFTQYWIPLSYRMSAYPEEAWTEVPGQPWFESSLSVPVYFYDRQSRATPRVAGILAFSTEAPDPFEPPDYLMAECFAQLISQALYLKETMQRAATAE